MRQSGYIAAVNATTTRKTTREPQRIAKLLARAGIASRREIERMIAEGRIAIDGKLVDTPATLLTSLRGVTVDGNPVAAPAPARLFLFHKPAGVLTTERDPKGRRTIYDVLPDDLPRLVPVGRLDLNTEGLLLMTTDGELKRQLELPATGIERSYRARAFGPVTQDALESLSEGVEIEGIRYGSIDANLERRTGANSWIELTLTEGKNREVRRVLEYLGLEVSRLIRTRYGPFVLADLPSGAIGEVRQHDLVAFRKTLKLPATARRYDPVMVRPTPAAEAPQATAEEVVAKPARATPRGAPRKTSADGVQKPARAARARAHREARADEAGVAPAAGPRRTLSSRPRSDAALAEGTARADRSRAGGRKATGASSAASSRERSPAGSPRSDRPMRGRPGAPAKPRGPRPPRGPRA